VLIFLRYLFTRFIYANISNQLRNDEQGTDELYEVKTELVKSILRPSSN
jgi:hypothetical protein